MFFFVLVVPAFFDVPVNPVELIMHLLTAAVNPSSSFHSSPQPEPFHMVFFFPISVGRFFPW